MRNKGVSIVLSSLAVLSIVVSGFAPATTLFAAKAGVSMRKKCNVTIGKTKKITLSKKGVKKLVSVKWKLSKKNIASLSKQTKSSVTVKGLKEGNVKLTANVKYKTKKTLSKKLTCTVTVKADKLNTPAPTQTASEAPKNTPTNQPQPTATPVPKPTRTPGPQNLLSALGDYVKNVGSCISYSSWNGPSSLDDADIKAYVKENLNSLTAENEMKPEGVLGKFAPTIIRINQAASQGIIIPDSYNEVNVPVLNYDNIDKLLKYAHDNNIRVRYHGLLWHEQTPNWFFRKGYDSNAAFVTPEVMDARLEYYIKNIMNHVYTSPYADTLYCWDVVNEFYHMTECIDRITNEKHDKTEDVKCFYNVYGGEIFEDPSSPETSKVVDNPRYVKLAFKWAYEMLEQFGLTDSVELVYNDYDTNFADVRASILAITKYINEKDEINPDGKKLVTTVGMQTHDNLNENKYLIEDHKATMDAIKASGLNIQVTEMDLALGEATLDKQLKYWSDFTNLLINEAKSGANITGFTVWGLTDKNSWLGESQSPLLCGSSVKDKKKAYYTIIDTAYSTTID